MSKNEATNRVAGAAAIVTLAILVSKITGFFRTALIPNVITDRSQTDAFYLSFTITDFMFNLLVGGAISAAIVPVLSGFLSKKKEKEGWVAIGTYMNLTFITIIFLSILGIIFTPQIIDIAASKFTPEQKALTVTLTRILFPSVCFIMLAGLTNSVLYSYKKFAAAAFGSSIYNIASVISIITLSKFGVKWIVTGIMISAFIYFMFQFSFAFKFFIKNYSFKMYLKDPEFKKVLKLAIPSLASSSVIQFNVFISAFFTSKLSEGSLTAYRNANDTWQLPYGIFAMGIGYAMLPSLSEKAALGKLDEYKNLVLKSIKVVLMLNIPAAIAFVVMRSAIISCIYKWSNSINIEYTGNILTIFTIALIGYSVLAIAIRAFYAINDTVTPFLIGFVTIFINIGLCYLFLENTKLEAVGMAIAYSVAASLNAVALLLILDKKIHGIELLNLMVYILKITFAGIVMAIVLYIFQKYIIPIDFENTNFSRVLKIKELIGVGSLILVGGIVYGLITLKLKLEEAIYVKKLLLKKLQPIINLSNKFIRK
ncbi:MAG: murein biosynthesis integral membrane protein MurJ [Clostridiales bacterium]